MLVTARVSSVADFYIGKSVFVTGGTGFIGKVLIEKLLYSCPGIDKVYTLIRKKKKLDEDERLNELIQSPVFTRVREERPQDLKKIVLVPGELEAPNLGIPGHNLKALLEQVSVVFHSAATVNFNTPLRKAVTLNIEGTRRTLDLSQRMKNLQAFVHVSTMFCTAGTPMADEVYPPPAQLKDVYNFLEENDHDEMKLKKLLNGHSNTYTFTKALSESLLKEERGDVPLIILRPSVVFPAINEPMEGWIDNMQAALAIVAAVGKGWMRVLPGDAKSLERTLDIIPVDYVSNMAIVAATRSPSKGEVQVYNCCSGDINPISSKDTFNYFVEASKRNGFNDFPWPGLIVTKHNSLLTFSILLETAFAYFLDLMRTLQRKEPKYIKLRSKLALVLKIIEPVMMSNWPFRSERARALVTSLPPSDRRLFPCHPADIDWKSYLETCNKGVMKYLPKS